MDMRAGLHAALTGQIITAARRVHANLGYGFLEKVYRNALALELSSAGYGVSLAHPIEVRYLGQVVGIYEADVLVDELVIVETKAVEHLIEAHEVQLVNYLRATRIEIGLLINFGAKFEVRRKIFTNDRKVS
jgi:GxxExxY protein